MSSYDKIYNDWLEHPQAFWGKAAELIDWFKPYDKVFDENAGVYGRWFEGGKTNACYNAIDRHIKAGRGEQVAIYYDSPVSNGKRAITYQELSDEVQALAAFMQDIGVKKGDRVLIYMPMIPQVFTSVFACTRIGAVHSIVFGGFSARELAVRIDDCQPKIIIAASCGIEPTRVVPYQAMVNQAIDIANHEVEHCIVHERPIIQKAPEGLFVLQEGRDFDYAVLIKENMGRKVDCVELDATDPLYILYTSGTTGKPKGVMRDIGGYIVALSWTMGAVFNIKPGEVMFTASDVGWVVGHSYILYAPLLIGATSVLYEGKPVGTPDPGTFWRVCKEYNVRSFFSAPTAFRSIKREDPDGDYAKSYDLPNLQAMFVAGERADPDTLEWATSLFNVPVIDNWWQTETGWPIAANPLGIGLLPIKFGSPTRPMPGYATDVLDDDGNKVAAGTFGNLAFRLPLPPGCLPTLWHADEQFKKTYLERFPGYYNSSDAGYIDDDGYVFVMSRTDDIINVAGHRLSTGGMEEAIAGHHDVAECAVIGIHDKLKGQVPCGFIVLNHNVDRQETIIEKECVARIREIIGPVAAFKLIITVQKLPKTRSGKILRGMMRKIVDGEQWTVPSTIEDPATLYAIEEVVKTRDLH
ncbi:AMP-binding protein [uncultured Bartonella sp.]|uniref:AMP-binding protein n=1 Tax=uncultured Bartonella sp. TaxID=104108 RepID=UPI0026132E22|nr:AMP-binding protein [uncultured Bartonella sp.]